MKKTFKTILTVFVLFSGLMLAACGSKEGSKPSPDSKYIGKWTAVKAVLKGEETPMEDILTEGTYVLDLKADGTAVVTTTTEATGTWTEKSNGVHVKAGDTDADFPEEDGHLTLKILTATIVFDKE